jgi:hypothetical protein
MNWRRWNWLEEGMIPLLVVVLRICWIWPWLEWLRRWLSPSAAMPYLPLWALAFLFVGGAFAARLALARTSTLKPNSLRRARLWVVAAGLGVIAVLLWQHYSRAQYALWDVRWASTLAYELTHWQEQVPPAFAALLVAAAVWLRGMMDGREPMLHEDVWGVFTRGFLALALLLLATRADPNGPPPHIDRWTVALFAVGMTALALSSLQLAHITGRWGASPRADLRMNRYWLATAAAVIAVLLVLGLGLSWLVAPETVARAFSWVGVLLNLVGVVLGYVLLAFAYVVFWLLSPLIDRLRELMSRLRQNDDPFGSSDFLRQLQQFLETPSQELPPATVESLRWLGFAALLIVIAIAFALALRYFGSRHGEETDETRELIFSSDLLQEQLASLWRKWRQRFSGRAAGKADPYLSLAGEMENRRLIRAIYQAMLAAATAQGHGRVQAQTPVEYQAALTARFPTGGAALATITAGYMQARYGLDPPPASQVEAVQRAWDALQEVLTNNGTIIVGQNER